MCFGNARPVQRRGGEQVLVAFALVPAHTGRGLVLDTCVPQEDVFRFPLIAAFGLLAVAIAMQVGPDGIEVMPKAMR